MAKRVKEETAPAPAAEPGGAVEFRVSNVEGVGGELALRFAPGLNLLLGENGAGKSGATLAVVVAAGGEGRLHVHDGAEKGFVRSQGLVLTVGGRVTRSGAPAVEVADYGRLIELVRPQGKTRETRDKARAEALCEYVDRPLDEALVLDLAGGDEEVAAGVSRTLSRVGGLHELASAVKKMAEAIAREQEERRDEATGAAKDIARRVAQADEELAGYPRPSVTVEGMETVVRDRAGLVGRLKGEREVLLARQEERERVGDIGARPDVDALRARYEAQDAVVERLRAELAEAETALEVLATEGRGAAEAARRWDRQRELLDAPLEGPTAEVVAEAEASLRAGEGDLDAVRRYAARDELTAERLRLEAVAHGHDAAATARREVARGVMGRLNAVLAGEDFGDLRLDEDGSLAVLDRSTGELEPFERLSQGEQWIAVLLSVAPRRYPAGLFPVHPDGLHALQPANMRRLVAEALERGWLLVSEHATDQPGVHQVHVGREWVEGEETLEQYALRAAGG